MQLLTLLQAQTGDVERLKNWLIDDFAPRASRLSARPQRLIVNIAVTEPKGLVISSAVESAGGTAYDAVVEASFANPEDGVRWQAALQDSAPVPIAAQHDYAVTMYPELQKASYAPGRPASGFKLIRGLFFYDDLSDEAAQRIWAHHAPLAAKVHIGLSRYTRHWVNAVLNPQTPAVRGFSDLHFPDESSLMEHYYDSERGREEIVQDTGHFISAALARVFTQEHTFI